MLRCTTLWSLQIDNDVSDYVIVFLGDLGEYLPENERPYWKTFNVIPDGSMSQTNYRRSLLAEWAEPESLDHVFKNLYKRAGDCWYKKYGWFLFLPLHEADENYFNSLRLLLTDDQVEFDSQVLNLTKLMVDSLNEAELTKGSSDIVSSDKGLLKFEKFLNSHSATEITKHISFLRQLQSLRSAGVAHRKGSGYDKISNKLSIEKSGFKNAFKSIQEQANFFLESVIGFCEENV